MAGGQKVQRGGTARTAKAAAARHKRPCRSAPSVPEFTVSFRKFQAKGKRRVWGAVANYDAVTTDVADRPLTVETYQAQLRYTDASGVPISIDGHDDDTEVQNRAGDEATRIIFKDISRPRAWYVQIRMRVLNRVHGGRCWSGWSSWSEAVKPTSGAIAGPSAPSGIALKLDKVEGTAKYPWRARVTGNELTTWEPEDDDGVVPITEYGVKLAVSNDGGATTANTRYASVPADSSLSKFKADFFNVRGKRAYRAAARAKDADGNWGAYSAWTSWLSPGGAPAPVENLTLHKATPGRFVWKWDRPTDPTDAVEYRVVVRRMDGGAGTVVDTGFTAGNRWQYDIPTADRVFPHKARVTVVEDDLSVEVDDADDPAFDDGDASTDEDSAEVTNDTQWTADDIDVTTLPAAPTDGDPPDDSPAVELISGIGVLFARWAGTVNADPVTYEVHISDVDSSFTPDGTTLYAETDATAITIKALADGTPLAYGTDYFVKIIAKDADGSAAAGDFDAAQTFQVNTVDIVVQAITTQLLAAESVTVDKLAAVLIITNVLKTATSGRRVEVDGGADGGIKLIDTDESVLVNLPLDPDTPATFTGELLAEALTATGAVELRSALNVLTKDSTLTLNAGQGPPSAAPGLTQGLASANADWDADFGTLVGFWHDGTNLYAYYQDSTAGTYFNNVVKYGPDGTSATATVALSMSNVTNEIRALCKIGSYWYGLVYRHNTDVMLWHVWDDTGTGGLPGARTASASWAEWNDAGASLGAAINVDGAGGLVTAQSNLTFLGGSTAARLGKYSVPGTGAVPSFTSAVTTSVTGVVGSGGVNGVYYGSADLGATRWVLRCAGKGTVRTFNTSGTVQAAEQWNTSDGATTSRGFGWDGSYFIDAGSSGNTLTRYSTFITPGASSTVFWAAFTWYDSDATGGTHETALSPRSTITLQNRRNLTWTWPTIPDSGGTDDPNAVRLYLKANATDPGSAFASYFRQGSTFTGTAIQMESYSTSTAGSQDTAFAGGTGATVKPAVTTHAELKGNGDGFEPVGAIIMFGGSAAPTGWLLCNGASVLRSDYPELFTAISTTYGSVDGTHFTLPNMAGRVPVAPGGTLAAALGDSAGSMSHGHVGGDTGGPSGIGPNATDGPANRPNNSHTHSVPAIASLSKPPAYVAVNFIIKT